MISKQLSSRIEAVHGEAGRGWLVSLPKLIEELSERWSLRLDDPFQNLSYNLVMRGHNPNGPIVLKLGVPCPELSAEAAALQIFAGIGAVTLLEHDANCGALLLELISPGISLHQLQDDATATQTAARLMQGLWREPPPEHHFPSLKVWFRALERLRARGGGPFPRDVITRAEATLMELLTSSPRALLLHGDLHHDNILYSVERGWLAIDPKGVCGDPGYEVGSFMLNQLPSGVSPSELRKLLDQRLSIFSRELHLEQLRLARWSFCYAVLSTIWRLEDSEDYDASLSLAQMLEQLATE